MQAKKQNKRTNTKRLSIRNLSKRYYIGELQETKSTTLYEKAKLGLKEPINKIRGLLKGHSYAAIGLDEELWALKNLSFTVNEGEIVGIIGRNGAGKSTLLKILSQITPPTTGEIKIKGKLSSLLEVGTGFHGNLTGRENIYLNGSILGMSNSEIESKLDDIISFSGIAKFIDTPVRFYSSGMTVRLAFSVAAHLDPDILIIDEVLAVGDISFHKKSMKRMKEITKSGKTILFVSHQIGQISALCNRVILMDKGKILADGQPSEIIAKYFDLVKKDKLIELRNRTDRIGTQTAKFTAFWVESDGLRKTTDTVFSGQMISFCGKIESQIDDDNMDSIALSIGLNNDLGQNISILSSHPKAQSFNLNKKKELTFKCTINRFQINNGNIQISLCAHRTSADFTVIDSIENVLSITVLPGDYYNTGIIPGTASTVLFDYDFNCR